jgi:hypothetical protein
MAALFRCMAPRLTPHCGGQQLHVPQQLKGGSALLPVNGGDAAPHSLVDAPACHAPRARRTHCPTTPLLLLPAP